MECIHPSGEFDWFTHDMDRRVIRLCLSAVTRFKRALVFESSL